MAPLKRSTCTLSVSASGWASKTGFMSLYIGCSCDKMGVKAKKEMSAPLIMPNAELKAI